MPILLRPKRLDDGYLLVLRIQLGAPLQQLIYRPRAAMCLDQICLKLSNADLGG